MQYNIYAISDGWNMLGTQNEKWSIELNGKTLTNTGLQKQNQIRSLRNRSDPLQHSGTRHHLKIDEEK